MPRAQRPRRCRLEEPVRPPGHLVTRQVRVHGETATGGDHLATLHPHVGHVTAGRTPHEVGDELIGAEGRRERGVGQLQADQVGRPAHLEAAGVEPQGFGASRG